MGSLRMGLPMVIMRWGYARFRRQMDGRTDSVLLVSFVMLKPIVVGRSVIPIILFTQKYVCHKIVEHYSIQTCRTSVRTPTVQWYVKFSRHKLSQIALCLKKKKWARTHVVRGCGYVGLGADSWHGSKQLEVSMHINRNPFASKINK